MLIYTEKLAATEEKKKKSKSTNLFSGYADSFTISWIVLFV